MLRLATLALLASVALAAPKSSPAPVACVDGVDNVIAVQDLAPAFGFDEFHFHGVELLTYGSNSNGKLSDPSCAVTPSGNKVGQVLVPGFFQLARNGSITVPHNAAGLKKAMIQFTASHDGITICMNGNIVIGGFDIDPKACSQAFCPAFGEAACNDLVRAAGTTVNVADLSQDAFNVGYVKTDNIPKVILDVLGRLVDGFLAGSGAVHLGGFGGRFAGGGKTQALAVRVL